MTSCRSFERTTELVVIGLAQRLEASVAATEIPRLWQRFQREHALPRPPGDAATYAVYCDYESDWRGAYTLVLGVAAAADAPVPAGMRRVAIPPGRYARFSANGDPAQVIWQTWMHINTVWCGARQYLADYERYTDDEAEIAVGVQ
jgi:predicted transcriptional regulator YdeE